MTQKCSQWLTLSSKRRIYVELRKSGPTRPIILTGGNEEPSEPRPSSDLGALGALVVNPSTLFTTKAPRMTATFLAGLESAFL